MKKLMALVLSIIMIACVAAGCAVPAATDGEVTESAATQAPKAETSVETKEAVRETAEGMKNESEESTEEIIAQVIDTDMSVLKGLKVGFAQRITTIAWEAAVLDDIKAAAEKYEIDFICTDGDNDQSKQIADVEDLCAQGIDVLIYPAVEYEAGAAALEIAAQYEVPVFLAFTDCKKEANQYVAAAQTSYVNDGKMCAQWIIDNMESAKIVEIQGQLGSDTEIGRETGFGETIAAAGDNYEIIVQQTGNFMMDDAQAAMENIIQSYNGQFDTVYAHNDEMALGVVAALKAAGLEGIKVVTIDGQKAAVQEVINGNITAIITCEHRIGEQIFSMIAAYKNGEDQPKDTIIPSQIIDANNAEEAMTNGMAF